MIVNCFPYSEPTACSTESTAGHTNKDLGCLMPSSMAAVSTISSSDEGSLEHFIISQPNNSSNSMPHPDVIGHSNSVGTNNGTGNNLFASSYISNTGVSIPQKTMSNVPQFVFSSFCAASSTSMQPNVSNELLAAIFSPPGSMVSPISSSVIGMTTFSANPNSAPGIPAMQSYVSNAPIFVKTVPSVYTSSSPAISNAMLSPDIYRFPSSAGTLSSSIIVHSGVVYTVPHTSSSVVGDSGNATSMVDMTKTCELKVPIRTVDEACLAMKDNNNNVNNTPRKGSPPVSSSKSTHGKQSNGGGVRYLVSSILRRKKGLKSASPGSSSPVSSLPAPLLASWLRDCPNVSLEGLKRPHVDLETVHRLLDLSDIYDDKKKKKFLENQYTAQTHIRLGEGGRELLRSCLAAKGLKCSAMQGANIIKLIQLAYEHGLWNIVNRINAERQSGNMCKIHAEFTQFKSYQFRLREWLKRQSRVMKRKIDDPADWEAYCNSLAESTSETVGCSSLPVSDGGSASNSCPSNISTMRSISTCCVTMPSSCIASSSTSAHFVSPMPQQFNNSVGGATVSSTEHSNKNEDSSNLGLDGRAELRKLFTNRYNQDPTHFKNKLNELGYKYEDINEASIRDLLHLAFTCNMWDEVLQLQKDIKRKTERNVQIMSNGDNRNNNMVQKVGMCNDMETDIYKRGKGCGNGSVTGAKKRCHRASRMDEGGSDCSSPVNEFVKVEGDNQDNDENGLRYSNVKQLRSRRRKAADMLLDDQPRRENTKRRAYSRVRQCKGGDYDNHEMLVNIANSGCESVGLGSSDNGLVHSESSSIGNLGGNHEVTAACNISTPSLEIHFNNNDMINKRLINTGAIGMNNNNNIGRKVHDNIMCNVNPNELLVPNWIASGSAVNYNNEACLNKYDDGTKINVNKIVYLHPKSDEVHTYKPTFHGNSNYGSQVDIGNIPPSNVSTNHVGNFDNP